MKRRDFLKKAGIGAAAVAATAVNAPKVRAAKTYNWKMVTTWPPKLPVLQDGCERLAKRIGELSDGRIRIQVFAAGELVPALESFQAVSDGTVEVGSGAAYYWAGKEPATQWFSAVPFGLNGQGMSAWFYGGDGLKLWEETYAPFNLIPRPGGSTGVQMGGWFNKKIETIDDFKERIPGLGGKVLAKAGGTCCCPAVKFSPPWARRDRRHRVGGTPATCAGRQVYYYPGWHEPPTWNTSSTKRPTPGQIIDAGTETEHWVLSQFEARNGQALQTLINDKNAQVFPDQVLADLRKLSEEAAKTPMATKVNKAFREFQKVVGVIGKGVRHPVGP